MVYLHECVFDWGHALFLYLICVVIYRVLKGCRGYDHMVVAITTYAISAHNH
jgi:hypothetical protein